MGDTEIGKMDVDEPSGVGLDERQSWLSLWTATNLHSHDPIRCQAPVFRTMPNGFFTIEKKYYANCRVGHFTNNQVQESAIRTQTEKNVIRWTI